MAGGGVDPAPPSQGYFEGRFSNGYNFADYLSFDLTGDGSWDRVETYRYFATNDVPGFEHYTQKAGLTSATGALGAFAGGRVKVEVWNAIGVAPTTLGTGNRSTLTLPIG